MTGSWAEYLWSQGCALANARPAAWNRSRSGLLGNCRARSVPKLIGSGWNCSAAGTGRRLLGLIFLFSAGMRDGLPQQNKTVNRPSSFSSATTVPVAPLIQLPSAEQRPWTDTASPLRNRLDEVRVAMLAEQRKEKASVGVDEDDDDREDREKEEAETTARQRDPTANNQGQHPK